jgi:site-specific DNA-methyltransferase (adenine-specific)
MIDLKKGDCLELMASIPDKSIDLVLCDLPYGITKCEWDVAIPFDKLWEQYNRIIKDRGCIALFGLGLFSSRLILSNEKNYKYDLIWKKNKTTGQLSAKKRPLRNYENIHIFGGKKGINYYPVMTNIDKFIKGSCVSAPSKVYDHLTIRKGYDHYGNYPKSILEFKVVPSAYILHPTQKPVDLLEYLINLYTLENDIILDNCMGSGSTGIACINTNRNFIGIEKDDRYFAIAENRIHESKLLFDK